MVWKPSPPNYDDFGTKAHAWGEWIAVRLMLSGMAAAGMAVLVWLLYHFELISSTVWGTLMETYIFILGAPLYAKLLLAAVALWAMGFVVLLFAVGRYDPVGAASESASIGDSNE